jgi:hypothetical protein
MDWAQPINLCKRPVGKFVYGPFSWKKNYPYKVDKEDWIRALPALLDCRTTTGVMFAHGFEDKILERVASQNMCFLTKDMIADAKKKTPGNPLADYVPVDYSEIDIERKVNMKRCIPQPSKMNSKSRPYLYGNDDTSSNMSTSGASVGKRKKGKNKLLGMWMELETKAQKYTRHRQANNF